MPESKGTILYVGGFELPDKNAAAHRVLNNGKIFRELGYKVVFLGINHDIDKFSKETVQGFDSYSIPYPKTKKEWSEYLKNIEYLKQTADKINDLKYIIFYNYQSVCLYKALKYCKKNNIKSIVDITEWYLASGKNPVFYAIKQSDTSFRMRYLNKKADGIISISRYLTDYYKKSGCKNIIQLPPLIDKEEEKWKKTDLKEKSDKIKLVYAGSPGDIKDNLDIVIKNVSEFTDKIEFHILGIGKEQFIDKIGKEYLSDNIIVHGRVSHGECIEMIKKSDFQIFLRPDNLVTRAGFPTKFGESIACGTPLITNLSSNIDDYLIEGKNGYKVIKISDEAIKDVLKKITLLSHNDISNMSEYCLDYNKFYYKSYIKEVETFFKKMN